MNFSPFEGFCYHFEVCKERNKRNEINCDFDRLIFVLWFYHIHSMQCSRYAFCRSSSPSPTLAHCITLAQNIDWHFHHYLFKFHSPVRNAKLWMYNQIKEKNEKTPHLNFNRLWQILGPNQQSPYYCLQSKKKPMWLNVELWIFTLADERFADTYSVNGIPINANSIQNDRPLVVTGTILPYPEFCENKIAHYTGKKNEKQRQ